MNPLSTLKHAWNLFMYEEQPNRRSPTWGGASHSHNPTRSVFTRGNERTIVTSVYNRLAIDAASINIRHVRLDDNDRFQEGINSGLNNCLSVEANIDQAGRQFVQDIVASMLDEGCVAVVPVDTITNPQESNSYNILTMRTGRITQWFPDRVTVDLYNDETGMRQEVTVRKKDVAIIENPLYAVMNEPNSTMQRLIHKLSLMDSVDEESSSGSINLLVKLPYTIKTEAKRAQADARREEIESQLRDNKYGVAYIDSTENVTQLNRPLENNLMNQIEYLTNLLYSQLGITQAIMDGTAEPDTMNNYYNRTIEPILGAIVDEFTRKFLTKTARSQKQSITYFRDPFKLLPVGQVAELADKFTRNEIASSNEMRQAIGMKPSKDPSADELRNKNLSRSKGSEPQPTQPIKENKEESDNE